jgi:transposase
MESITVECLRCGENHRLESGPWRQLQSGECPRCGYLGWAPTALLSEVERRALRDRPLERRRLHAVA